MKTHELEYKGVIITIKGCYYDGDYDGDEPDIFEIESIITGNKEFEIDLTEMLEDNICEIEFDIIETYYR